MPYSPPERTRIGDAVRQRRIDLGLSKEDAATQAGVNSITWKRVEDAATVRDSNLGAIASTVGLTAADIDAIAVGRYMDDVATPHTRAPAITEATDEELLEEIRQRMGARHDMDTTKKSRASSQARKGQEAELHRSKSEDRRNAALGDLASGLSVDEGLDEQG